MPTVHSHRDTHTTERGHSPEPTSRGRAIGENGTHYRDGVPEYQSTGVPPGPESIRVQADNTADTAMPEVLVTPPARIPNHLTRAKAWGLRTRQAHASTHPRRASTQFCVPLRFSTALLSCPGTSESLCSNPTFFFCPAALLWALDWASWACHPVEPRPALCCAYLLRICVCVLCCAVPCCAVLWPYTTLRLYHPVLPSIPTCPGLPRCPKGCPLLLPTSQNLGWNPFSPPSYYYCRLQAELYHQLRCNPILAAHLALHLYFPSCVLFCLSCPTNLDHAQSLSHPSSLLSSRLSISIYSALRSTSSPARLDARMTIRELGKEEHIHSYT